MDDVIYVGMPACEEHLKSKYLVFESNCDGDLDSYLAGLATAFPSISTLSGAIVSAIPARADRQAFIDYMKACQIETTFFFAAVNDKSVPETLRALQTQTRRRRFYRDPSGRGCRRTLQREFHPICTRSSRSLPIPPAGSDGSASRDQDWRSQ